MDVRSSVKIPPNRRLRKESGQSLLEFLLLLPMMLGLTALMIRVNSTIQMSIVNQQYARAQALWLTFNSNTYPELRLAVPQMADKNYNQMTLGVSDNIVDGGEEGQDTIVPKASVGNIGRARGPAGDDSSKREPEERTRVRVRTTVTLCSQPLVVKTQNGYQPVLALSGKGNVANGPSGLKEGNIKYDYCRGVQTQ